MTIVIHLMNAERELALSQEIAKAMRNVPANAGERYNELLTTMVETQTAMTAGIQALYEQNDLVVNGLNEMEAILSAQINEVAK